MTGYQVFCTYIALKLHFTTDHYDYHKYGGKTSVDKTSYESRRDRFFFDKLAKHRDPFGFMLANFVDSKSPWVGELVQEEQYNKIYLDWLKRQQSLTYQFRQDLHHIPGFTQSLKVVDGKHPQLLQLYARRKICIETLLIIDDLVQCCEHWNEKISDPVYWPEVYRKLRKYRGFVSFDHNKMKNVLIGHYTNA